MKRNDIFEKVEFVLRDVLDNENLLIDNSSSSSDIDGWDSLAHIQIVYELQSSFGVKFSSEELMSWRNVGQMVSCIEKKLR